MILSMQAESISNQLVFIQKDINQLEDSSRRCNSDYSNSVADHGRVLALLEKEGLITLKDGVDKAHATIEDIVENPKNLEFESKL